MQSSRDAVGMSGYCGVYVVCKYVCTYVLWHELALAKARGGVGQQRGLRRGGLASAPTSPAAAARLRPHLHAQDRCGNRQAAKAGETPAGAPAGTQLRAERAHARQQVRQLTRGTQTLQWSTTAVGACAGREGDSPPLQPCQQRPSGLRAPCSLPWSAKAAAYLPREHRNMLHERPARKARGTRKQGQEEHD